MSVYLGLVHYPVYNKNNEIITTAVTNFDIHDIARTARTYEIEKYFIIHPLESQKTLVNEIIDYWQNGFGGEYNSDRKEAFSIIHVVSDILSAVDAITCQTGVKPITVATDARCFDNQVSYQKLREIITAGKEEQSYLLLFGTGWGVEKNAMSQFDYILEPIRGAGDYNHLPVRAAVAVILDRLLGEAWYNNK